jgi:hypothetical protein
MMFAYTKAGGSFPAYINLKPVPTGIDGFILTVRGDPQIEGNMTTAGKTAVMALTLGELADLRDHLNTLLP